MIKDLNSWVDKRYAYVNNHIIFNIDSRNNGDSCAKPISESPYKESLVITVNRENRYLDRYLQDGDALDENNQFKKTIHSESANVEEFKTFQAYFSDLCKEEVANAIMRYDYETLSQNLSFLGVPEWMIKQSGQEVGNVSQIDFTEEYYNTVKSQKVREKILENAKNTANEYGYKLTAPADISDITISIQQ